MQIFLYSVDFAYAVLFFLSCISIIGYFFKRAKRKNFNRNMASLPPDLRDLCREALEKAEHTCSMFCDDEVPSTRRVCSLVLESDSLSTKLRKILESNSFSPKNHSELATTASQVWFIHNRIRGIGLKIQLNQSTS